MAWLVLLLAVFMPVLIAFEEESEMLPPWFSKVRLLLLLCVDGLYLIDILVRFRCASPYRPPPAPRQPLPERALVSAPLRTTFKVDGQTVEDPAQISWHYLSTWFFCDLLAVLVPLASQLSRHGPLWLSLFYVLCLSCLRGKLVWRSGPNDPIDPYTRPWNFRC